LCCLERGRRHHARQLAEIDAERLLAACTAERVPELEAAFRLLVLLGKLL
jgi:hypothetical protein